MITGNERPDNTPNDDATGSYKVNSLRIDPRAHPMKDSVDWDPARSIWNGGMLLAAHSGGFHRRLIHRTFQCPKWVERTLVWMGTLVGMQIPRAA